MFGYKGRIHRILSSASVKVGDTIMVESPEKTYEGVLMPRTELGDADHVVLKLKNGYNIGVKVTKNTKIKLLQRGKPPELTIPKIQIERDPSKPNVTIIGTGGTIASRVDYRTGAVFPAFTPEEIYSAVPELAEIANIKVVEACNVFSEHMTPELWIKIGKTVTDEINSGADGVVIAHGTDTMHYTAAALSFMLKGLHRPVVLVGSQRSSDRPSSDAALNLISAVAVAGKSDIAEVCVVMHGSMNDDICLVHRGTRVRKCHTSRRDAFLSVNDLPLAEVREREVKPLRTDYNKASRSGRITLNAKFEPMIALIKITPGLSSALMEKMIRMGYRGFVLEGTGLGHVPASLFKGIRKAIKSKIPIVMTSQCIWGRVDMKVYSTGRDLIEMGVIPGEDMLSETAWVKLMWVLGQTRNPKKVAEFMRRNVAREISERTTPIAFPVGFPSKTEFNQAGTSL